MYGLKEWKKDKVNTNEKSKKKKWILTFNVRTIFLLWQSCYSLQLPSNGVCTTNLLLYEIYMKNIFFHIICCCFFHSHFVLLLYLINGSPPCSEPITFILSFQVKILGWFLTLHRQPISIKAYLALLGFEISVSLLQKESFSSYWNMRIDVSRFKGNRCGMKIAS